MYTWQYYTITWRQGKLRVKLSKSNPNIRRYTYNECINLLYEHITHSYSKPITLRFRLRLHYCINKNNTYIAVMEWPKGVDLCGLYRNKYMNRCTNYFRRRLELYTKHKLNEYLCSVDHSHSAGIKLLF